MHPIGLVDGTFAGTDPHSVYTLQLEEIGAPHQIALAELPEVGPHASGVGKVAANLSLPFELRSYGWQLQRGDRISSIDQLRAVSHRDSIIQALADVAADRTMPTVTVRLLGPVSMMISGWLPTGQRILRDSGARADITEAWAQAASSLVMRIRAVLGTAATIIIQEHDAQQAVAGRIRSASGADFEQSLDIAEVRSVWQTATAQTPTTLIETSSELLETATQVSGVLLNWPTGRSGATERTWELVDKLLQDETPVALHVERRENPKRYAEELIQQYLDWGLEPSGLEQINLVRQFHAEPEMEIGAGLQDLRVLAEHAAGYAASV